MVLSPGSFRVIFPHSVATTETFVETGRIESGSIDVERAFASIRDQLDRPCYILMRLSEEKWGLIQFMPERSPVCPFSGCI
jgi:hypothetical protein